MIVITTMPGTPLDNELLAAFSVGVPVGLCLYFAWLNRGWAAQTKAVGFAAGGGGALVGAWLGVHATEGRPALLTTILGATVGGNLAPPGLEIAWGRQGPESFPADPPQTLCEHA